METNWDCPKCLEEIEIQKKKGLDCYNYNIGKSHNCKRHIKLHNNNNNNNYNYNTKSWTDGKPYERSRRMKEIIKIENEEYKQYMNENAYSSSLHHDENTWEILNKSIINDGFKVSNKRQELGDKLSSRDMVQQIGFNPFMPNNNYVNDISIRDKYLKPINTSQDPLL